MNTQTVVKNLESAINWICKDIKAKKGGAGAEKLDSLAKLVNAYSRLIERDKEKEKEHDPMEDGDPTYYKKLEANNEDMRGIIR
jgi:hypothetical protein